MNRSRTTRRPTTLSTVATPDLRAVTGGIIVVGGRSASLLQYQLQTGLSDYNQALAMMSSTQQRADQAASDVARNMKG